MPMVRTATQAGLGQMKQTGAGSTPNQSFRTSSEMFGSVQARNASDAGSDLTDYANSLIRAEDERASMEIEQEIRDWQFETTMGKNGVYRKRGGNAIGSTKNVQEGYKKFSSELLKGRVVSGKARQKIEMYIGERGQTLEKEVTRYEMQQKRAYDNGLREARIKGAIEDAALYYNDPAKLKEAEAKIRSTLGRSAADNGWSGEEKEQQIEAEVSRMHKNVIDRMLVQNQGNGARAYLEANRNEIDGGDIIGIEKSVKVGVVAEDGQRGTDEIMALDLPETEALAKARSQYSGKQRDEIVKRLKIRYGEAESIASSNNKQLLQSGWQKISQGGTPDDLTPQELNAAGRQVDSMWTMAKNSKSRGKGFALSSETGVVQEWLGKTDAEIADEDITHLMPEMTEGDWNKVVKRKNDAERAIKELKDRPGQGATVERLLKEFAPKNWNVGLKSASAERRAQAQRSRDNMNAFIGNVIEKTGKLPTDGDMRKEAARIMMQVKTDGALWFSEDTVISEQGDTPLNKLKLDKADIVEATDIPKSALKEVERFIEDQGQPVTINNMIKVWESREAE